MRKLLQLLAATALLAVGLFYAPGNVAAATNCSSATTSKIYNGAYLDYPDASQTGVQGTINQPTNGMALCIQPNTLSFSDSFAYSGDPTAHGWTSKTGTPVGSSGYLTENVGNGDTVTKVFTDARRWIDVGVTFQAWQPVTQDLVVIGVGGTPGTTAPTIALVASPNGRLAVVTPSARVEGPAVYSWGTSGGGGRHVEFQVWGKTGWKVIDLEDGTNSFESKDGGSWTYQAMGDLTYDHVSLGWSSGQAGQYMFAWNFGSVNNYYLSTTISNIALVSTNGANPTQNNAILQTGLYKCPSGDVISRYSVCDGTARLFWAYGGTSACPDSGTPVLRDLGSAGTANHSFKIELASDGFVDFYIDGSPAAAVAAPCWFATGAAPPTSVAGYPWAFSEGFNTADGLGGTGSTNAKAQRFTSLKEQLNYAGAYVNAVNGLGAACILSTGCALNSPSEVKVWTP